MKKSLFSFAAVAAMIFCSALPTSAQNFYEYMVAAQNGDANAMYNVARMFNSEGDTAEGRSWMIKAANSGSVDAQVVLAYICQNEGNHKKAVYWMSKAAEQGDAEAEYELGAMYDEGLGVKKDKKKAVQLWTKAAEKDYGAALVELAYYYERRDPQRARKLAERALGHAKLTDLQEVNAKVLLQMLNK